MLIATKAFAYNGHEVARDEVITFDLPEPLRSKLLRTRFIAEVQEGVEPTFRYFVARPFRLEGKDIPVGKELPDVSPALRRKLVNASFVRAELVEATERSDASMRKCAHPDCSATFTLPTGRGRKPKYCVLHRRNRRK